MREFCGLLEKELEEFLVQEREAPYRKKQFFHWVYRKGITDYGEMSNISHTLKNTFARKVSLNILVLKNIETSCDNETMKFTWQLSDGQRIESVLLCCEGRRTVCVSSQVGCAARCAFCASGQGGFKRNLSSAEIIEQVVHIHSYLLKQKRRVTHVVFMGMGEPLDNYLSVVQALKILIHPELFAISSRRITLSTVGVVPGIENFTREGMHINLALSLHAPNQELRKKIVPSARKYLLEDILRAVRSYAQKSKRNITYEYVLIAGVNDQKEQAYELVALLKNECCCVNLIPFNPIPGVNLKRPTQETVETFRAILFDGGLRNTWRYTKGKDIAAACGQLALSKEEKLV